MRRSRKRDYAALDEPADSAHSQGYYLDMGGFPRINPDDPKLAHASPELRAILLGEAKPAVAEKPKRGRARKAAAVKTP